MKIRNWLYLLLWIPVAARTDEELLWRLPVSVETSTLTAVDPDPELWQAVEGNLQRIRIQDQDGHTVPGLIRQLKESETRVRREYLETTMEDPVPLPDNRFEFACSVKVQAGPVKGLVFELPMRDFERPVSVWGIAPDGKKTQLADHALLADYSRFLDLRNVEVTLPENNFNRFQIVLERAEEEKLLPYRDLIQSRVEGKVTEKTEWVRSLTRPLRIDRIRAYTEKPGLVPGQAREAALENLIMSQIPSEGTGTQIFELETGYRPVSALNVSAEELNFSRSVRIRIPVRSPSGESWRTDSTGHLTRIQYRGTLRRETVLRFPEQRVQRLRVEIDSGEQPPLTLRELKASGPVWQILFLAEPSQSYQIRVGETPASNQDVTVIQTLLKEGFDPERIGPRLINGTVKDPKSGSRLGRVIQSREFFIFGILLAAGVLGFGLNRAVKGIGLPEDSE